MDLLAAVELVGLGVGPEGREVHGPQTRRGLLERNQDPLKSPQSPCFRR